MSNNSAFKKTVSSDDEIQLFLKQLPGWAVVDINNAPHICRDYRFSEYLQGLEFARSIADIAEDADHHPQMLIKWGSCQVSWSTHDVNALQQLDFIMAAKCDQLFQRLST